MKWFAHKISNLAKIEEWSVKDVTPGDHGSRHMIEVEGLLQITPVTKCRVKCKSVFACLYDGWQCGSFQPLPLLALFPHTLPQPAAPLKVNSPLQEKDICSSRHSMSKPTVKTYQQHCVWSKLWPKTVGTNCYYEMGQTELNDLMNWITLLQIS